uniref:Uncharacterized protein n=1 Tax=Anopheles atroparvus TaxID=41427 RepID=A0A182JBH2_ANOAO
MQTVGKSPKDNRFLRPCDGAKHGQSRFLVAYWPPAKPTASFADASIRLLGQLREQISVRFHELQEVGPVQPIQLAHLERHHGHGPRRPGPKQSDRTEVGPVDQVTQLGAVRCVHGGGATGQEIHRPGTAARDHDGVLLEHELEPQPSGDVLEQIRRKLAEDVGPRQERPEGADFGEQPAAQVVGGVEQDGPLVEVARSEAAGEVARHLAVGCAREPLRPAERVDLVERLVVAGFAGVGRLERANEQQQHVRGPDPAGEQQQRLQPFVQKVVTDRQRVATLEADLERDHERAQVPVGHRHPALEIIEFRREELLPIGVEMLAEVSPKVARFQTRSVRDWIVDGVTVLIVRPQHVHKEVGFGVTFGEQRHGQQGHYVYQTSGPVKHVQRIQDGLEEAQLPPGQPQHTLRDGPEVQVDHDPEVEKRRVTVEGAHELVQQQHVRHDEEQPVGHVPPAQSVAYDPARVHHHHAVFGDVPRHQLQDELHPQQCAQAHVEQL